MERKEEFSQDRYHESQGNNKNDEVGNRDRLLDSEVNTDFPEEADREDLTNDESAGTDPQQVSDKPTFKRSNL